MKRSCSKSHRSAWAFTLTELLIVIAVMAGLAALLLPLMTRVKLKAQVEGARTQVGQIASAINEYVSAYNRFPISSAVLNGAGPLGEDYTYGSTFYGATGRVVVAGPGEYLNNNNELMAVLLDLEYYGNGQPTINKGHVKNPLRTKFLNAHMAADTNSPGIGPDGAYRDYWGITYIITIDLNNDGMARDIFYRNPSVSADPSDANRGLN